LGEAAVNLVAVVLTVESGEKMFLALIQSFSVAVISIGLGPGAGLRTVGIGGDVKRWTTTRIRR
jgi:hypothetical protein